MIQAGDIVLIDLPLVFGGTVKLRPALVLSLLPGSYQTVLLCGISTQLSEMQADWDERIAASDLDFTQSGLHRDSVIRLSYLNAVNTAEVDGVIGRVAAERLERLATRLAEHLAGKA